MFRSNLDDDDALVAYDRAVLLLVGAFDASRTHWS